MQVLEPFRPTVQERLPVELKRRLGCECFAARTIGKNGGSEYMEEGFRIVLVRVNESLLRSFFRVARCAR